MIEEVTSQEIAITNLITFDKARKEIDSTRLDFNDDGFVEVNEINTLLYKLEDINNISSASAIHRNLSRIAGNIGTTEKNNVVSVHEIQEDISELIQSLRLLQNMLGSYTAISMKDLNKISRKPSETKNNDYDLYIIHRHLDRKHPELMISKPKASLSNRDYYGPDNQFVLYQLPNGAENISKHIDLGTGSDAIRIDFGLNNQNNNIVINRSLWPTQIRDEAVVKADDTLLIKVPYDFSKLKNQQRKEKAIINLFKVEPGKEIEQTINPYSIIYYETKDSHHNRIQVPTNFGSIMVYGKGIEEPIHLFPKVHYEDKAIPYEDYIKRDKYLTLLDILGKA